MFSISIYAFNIFIIDREQCFGKVDIYFSLFKWFAPEVMRNFPSRASQYILILLFCISRTIGSKLVLLFNEKSLRIKNTVKNMSTLLICFNIHQYSPVFNIHRWLNSTLHNKGFLGIINTTKNLLFSAKSCSGQSGG